MVAAETLPPRPAVLPFEEAEFSETSAICSRFVVLETHLS